MTKKDEIIEGFAHVINSHSVENESNTPDFLVAEYLYDCLQAYNEAIVKRNHYYGNTAEGHYINPMKP